MPALTKVRRAFRNIVQEVSLLVRWYTSSLFEKPETKPEEVGEPSKDRDRRLREHYIQMFRNYEQN